ncbi:MAG TPA: AGE family epimerase/isomerase [Acidisarcina sp.]|nr:AGE family epimerase/isomerase [Acidisarcina sp.]
MESNNIMFESYRERYRNELLGSVVPFWLHHSIDREYGGYFTCLDREGDVYDTRKYIWLQGRAVWTLSKLYNDVERRQEWLEAAAQGVEFLRRHAFDDKGRCYFSLTQDGRPVSFQRKPFGAVFIVAGFLEYSKAVGDPELRHEAIDLFWKIKSWIEDPSLLDRPSFAGQPATSNLADVMVLMMMVLELMAVDNDPRYPGLLAGYIAAALKHREPRHNVLLERVSPDGTFLLDSPDGRLLNPGHSIEVTWFLLKALERLPDSKLQREVLGILESSLEFGWDKEYGGLFYFMDIEQRPTLALESTMKLWWPHTEALYAVILAYTLTRESRWLTHLERLDTYAFRHFHDPVGGEWFGYCDRQGTPTNLCKGNNYKGFFHVPRFLLYSLQQMEAFDRAK